MEHSFNKRHPIIKGQRVAAAPRLESNPYVCPGEKAGHHFVGLPRVWQRIRQRAGLDDVRLHDLRHSHASAAAGLGTPLQIIGALLGHSGPQTTARHAHLADSPVRAAAHQVTSHIAAALDGQPAGELIAFHKP
ncbi:MAG TPA: tyrosine-type recombinase/integrase [Thermoanaerobaculia bacterium]|nr:tyrosine-type recombinase/integrase [Thermoanaerobaculia bacterium]